jgi:hypothetical protein
MNNVIYIKSCVNLPAAKCSSLHHDKRSVGKWIVLSAVIAFSPWFYMENHYYNQHNSGYVDRHLGGVGLEVNN